MKKMYIKMLLTLLAGMLLGNATAQSLRGFNYQAVARDAAGNLLANQNTTVVFDIRQGTAAGALIYQETHNTNTNAYGLINLVMGKGTPLAGSFAAIDWSANDYFLGVTLNGSPLGASALESVPYSKVATDMDLDQLSDVNTSGAAPGQVLKWNGSNWAPATDEGTTYAAGAGLSLSGTTFSALDPSPTNEIQTLSLSGNALSLSLGGGSVNLPTGTTYTPGDGIAISGANAISATLGTSIQTGEIDNAAVTEPKIANSAVTAAKLNQSGAANGQVLKWNGTAWAPAADDGGTAYTAGDGINISGANAISATLGTSIQTGELDNLAVTDAKIANATITGAKLNSMGASNGNLLGYNGGTWGPVAKNTVSPWNIKANGDIEYPNGRAYIGPSWGALPSNFNLAVIDTTPTYIVVGGTTVNSGVAGGLAFTEGWNSLGPCGFQFTIDGSAFGNTGLFLTAGCPAQNDTVFETTRGGTIVFRDVVKVEHNQPPDNKFAANTVDADLHVNMRIFDNTTTTSTNRRRGLAIRHRSSAARQWNIATRDNNNLEFFYNGTLRGTFSSTNGVYTSNSDRKLKTGIEKMPSVLSKINSLDAYSYRFIWQTDEEPQRSLGFMAQDVRQHFPELVYEATFDDEESWLQMDYAGMSVIAIKAIQEQQEMIRQLQAELEALSAVVRQQETLLQRLARLEQLLPID